MRPLIILLVVIASVGLLAQTQPDSARRIFPVDVEQGSIRLFRLGENSYAVKFSYTEAGAKKALAFWEIDLKHSKMSAEWKTGWLKRRTDKCFFQNEDAAVSFMKSIASK